MLWQTRINLYLGSRQDCLPAKLRSCAMGCDESSGTRTWFLTQCCKYQEWCSGSLSFPLSHYCIINKWMFLTAQGVVGWGVGTTMTTGDNDMGHFGAVLPFLLSLLKKPAQSGEGLTKTVCMRVYTHCIFFPHICYGKSQKVNTSWKSSSILGSSTEARNRDYWSNSHMDVTG